MFPGGHSRVLARIQDITLFPGYILLKASFRAVLVVERPPTSTTNKANHLLETHKLSMEFRLILQTNAINCLTLQFTWIPLVQGQYFQSERYTSLSVVRGVFCNFGTK